jgi:hypothetical protein
VYIMGRRERGWRVGWMVAEKPSCLSPGRHGRFELLKAAL